MFHRPPFFWNMQFYVFHKALVVTESRVLSPPGVVTVTWIEPVSPEAQLVPPLI